MSTPSVSPDHRPLPVGAVLCLGTLLLFSLCYLLTFREMIDDAYISFRYADHWADGTGLVFNAGDAPVEGYSNFLWVAVLAAQRATLGWPTPAAALILIYGCSVGLLVSLYRVGPMVGLNGAVNRNLPGLLLALNPSFVTLGHMALETIPFACVLTLGLLRWLHERRTPDARPCAWLWLLAVALLRPEGIAFALGVVCYEGIWPAVERRRRWWAITCLGIVAPLVVYHGVRYAYFRQWLPNPFYAKVPLGRWEAVRMGLHYAAGFLLTHDGLYHTLRPLRFGMKWLLLLPVGYAAWRRPSGASLPLAAAAFAYTGFIIIVGGDWMPFHRFFGHILPLLVILAVQGLDAWDDTAPPRRRVGAIVLCIGIVFGQIGEGRATDMPLGPAWYRDVAGFARHPVHALADAWSRIRAHPHPGRQMAEWLNDRYPPGTLITLDAVGLVPYYADELRYIDTLGLADRDVAQHLHARDPKAAADAVLAREPRVISNDVFARGTLRRLQITQVDRHIIASETYRTWYRIVHVREQRLLDLTPPTVAYAIVSERREMAMPPPGEAFEDQLAAYLAGPGADTW